ncbi:MAG: sulfite exporter TauE/SafE family protein [Defluviimonas sp.]|uniref:sulfite exporter TauE/SafE family protein n=1 Tax=Albidovulum sp. TaxID=1872424 RepID=UPI001D4C3C4C|nr:sulfite exporter TauE/SafE family protein [Paracoccaceae bacterium]MCC0063005.1 sulfite exporter TauE/SafE family protein [Defluviimonas sp.]
MEGAAFWAAALIASALVGLAKGGLPVVAILSVPIMAQVMPPVAAAGLLLPVYVVSDMFGLYAYRHAFDRRVLAIIAPAATFGVALGWATAALVPEWLVTGLIGLIGTVFALRLILGRGAAVPARPARVGPGLFWGTLAGFTSFVSHAGAPPYQVYVLPLRLEKAVFAGTSTVLFAYVNAIKLIPYWALGTLTPADLKVAAVLMVPAALAVLAGVRLVRILPEVLFFRIVTWALLALSLQLLWKAFRAA